MQSSLTPYLFSFAQQEQLSAMRGDALTCIKAVQHRVAQALVRSGAPDRLVRLAHWDVLETLLARAGACIAESKDCPGEERASVREAYMRLHLELTLATWLGTRAVTANEINSVRRCLRLLQTEQPA